MNIRNVIAKILLSNMAWAVFAMPAYAQPKQLALLIGIDEYKSDNIEDLKGGVNDVVFLSDVLREHYGFTDDQLVVLKNEQATHDEIIRHFRRHLIDRADGDTAVLFHFSGRGSRVADTNGDESDGLDETIVAHDSRHDAIPDIDDDVLNALFAELSTKSKHAVGVFDCGLSPLFGPNAEGNSVPGSRGLLLDLRRASKPVRTRVETVSGVPPKIQYGRILASPEGEQCFEGLILKDLRGYLSYAMTVELVRRERASGASRNGRHMA